MGRTATASTNGVHTEPIDWPGAIASADLEALIEADCGPAQNGFYFCLFHDDRNRPNLRVERKGDRTRFRCYGCGAEGDAVDYVAKRDSIDKAEAARKLLGSEARPDGGSRKPRQATASDRKPKTAHPTLEAAIEAISRHAGRAVARWEYRGPDGSTALYVVRFETSTGGKEYRPFHKAAAGWVCGDPPGPLPLYRLPEVLEAGPDATVWVVEGEKCADLAAALGLTATTWPHGAQSVSRADWTPLAGPEVVYCPDADEAGEKSIDALKKALAGLDPRPTLRVLHLPGLEPASGEDLAEWLERRPAGSTSANGAAELIRLAAAIEPESLDAKAESVVTFPLTDLGNAERLVSQHRGDMGHIHPWRQWVIWDGTRYAPDQVGAITSKAKQTVRSIYEEAAAEEDDKARMQIAAHARRSEGKDRIAAMIDLARSSVPLLPEDLNREPWLLNCTNGTLDLRNATLRPHRREDRITQLCPVPYQPEAECPLWLETLHLVFDGKEELTGFWKRLCGMVLTGVIRDQILLVAHGCGSNGKSTILGTMLAMLGPDYAMKAPRGLLTIKSGSAHPTELADLHGKRLVVAIETGEDAKLDEVLVKELTGGDPIRARRMRQDFWQFNPTHKVIFVTNHLPSVRGTDHAIWRRIRLAPFDVTISESKAVKDMGDRLLAELPGILAWCVQGCLEWQRDGLGMPSVVEAATADYRRHEDVLAEFIKECCAEDRNGKTMRAKASALYAAYVEWCGADTAPSQRKFGQALQEKGFERVKDGVIWYLGIGLLQTQPHSKK